LQYSASTLDVLASYNQTTSRTDYNILL